MWGFPQLLSVLKQKYEVPMLLPQRAEARHNTSCVVCPRKPTNSRLHCWFVGKQQQQQIDKDFALPRSFFMENWTVAMTLAEEMTVCAERSGLKSRTFTWGS